MNNASIDIVKKSMCVFFDQLTESKKSEIVSIYNKSPVTYETDGKKKSEIKAQFHYYHPFKANSHFFITELDCLEEQRQAFGVCQTEFTEGEFGYIDIKQLLEAGFLVNYNFKPTFLTDISLLENFTKN